MKTDPYDYLPLTSDQNENGRRLFEDIRSRPSKVFPATVHFTQDELKIFHELAIDRGKYNRSLGIENKRVSKTKSDVQIDYEGIIGEMSVCRVLNIPESQVHARCHSKVDLRKGTKTISVKALAQKHAFLYYPPHQTFTCDVAFLVKVLIESDPVVLGWITREHFEDIKLPLDFGYNTVYGVAEELLCCYECKL